MNYEVVVGGSLSQENKQNGDADLSLLISGEASLEIAGESEGLITTEADGDAELSHLVDGEGVEFFGAVTQPYDGAYEVTPSRQTQVLPTALKTLSHNIVVNPIPSNYGLITWNGNKLTVS